MDQEVYRTAGRNPLANYALQTENRVSSVQKRIRDTSLRGDIRLDFAKISDDEKVFVRHDYGNFNFCKLMYSAQIRNKVLQMAPNTQKLFLWLIYNLGTKSETIELNFDKKQLVPFGMSRNTFSNAIMELERNEIIKRIGVTKRAADYWMFYINPQVMFVGDAKRYYQGVVEHHPDYRV